MAAEVLDQAAAGSRMTRELSERAMAGVRFVVQWSTGWRPYLFALLLLSVATLVRGALQPWLGDRLYFTTYFPAVGIVAAVCGLLPGLATLAGATVLAWFFFLPPPMSFHIDKFEGLQLAFFVTAASPMLAIAAVLNLLVHWLLRQQELLASARRNEARQNEILVRELEHRMRNLFVLVQSIALKTLQGAPDEARARDEFAARLRALAEASTARLGDTPTLDHLLQRQLALYAGRVAIEHCRPIALKPNHAQELALIFHELATNAAKHGALSSPAGRVSAVCRIDEADGDNPMFSFEWTESGGPAVTAPGREGFGAEILKRGPEYAGAKVTLEYRPGGLYYRYRQRLRKISEAA